MKRVGFVCFGEVNTPFERLLLKHNEALEELRKLPDYAVTDAGIVIDDPAYDTAGTALDKLSGIEMDCLILCVAGWIPTHAVIYVTDPWRHVPMVLWGLCGWQEKGRLVTTADQAGTTAIRPAMEAMGYTFRYIYSVINKPLPMAQINDYVSACYARRKLRHARIGTMGYRDMLLYGTQFEGNSMRGQLGVEVEPFEMLEMVQNVETLDPEKVAKGAAFVREHWRIQKPCEDSVIEKGVKYALAVGRKIEERGYEAVSLIDVDGMKKLLGFPPAMIFMLLEQEYHVLTVPENDIMGAVTQLILKYLTGQTAPYLEYYEFFENSMLIGVPDFIPETATEGRVEMLPAAFGHLASSLLNVSKVRTGYVTCARLVYLNGHYKMHMYTAEARTPEPWNEYGWEEPAPQLPSLEVFPDSCTVEEFAQKVSGQHVIVVYGDYANSLKDFCRLMNIEVM